MYLPDGLSRAALKAPLIECLALIITWTCSKDCILHLEASK